MLLFVNAYMTTFLIIIIRENKPANSLRKVARHTDYKCSLPVSNPNKFFERFFMFGNVLQYFRANYAINEVSANGNLLISAMELDNLWTTRWDIVSWI